MHLTGVVMGSRWLAVPTPKAQFSQGESKSKSLLAFQRYVSKSAQRLPT